MPIQSPINPLKGIAVAACLFLPSLASASETFGSQGQWVPSGTASYNYNTSITPDSDTSYSSEWNDSPENETVFDAEPTYFADLSVTGHVLYHPASNFFIGFGPVWYGNLASSRDDRVVDPEGYKNTKVRFLSTFGGWF